MVAKSYLKYEPSHTGAIIASSNANYSDCVILPPTQNSSPSVFVPMLEGVGVWNLKSGQLQENLIPEELKNGSTAEVTAIRVETRGDSTLVLVGYASGYVGVFRGNFSSREKQVRWSCQLYAVGHKTDTSVFALAVDAQGVTLCTGGQDTDITCWDISAQEALYRMKGHRGAVVSMEIVKSSVGGEQFVISGSADGLVKIWNMNVQQSVQTIVASDTQVTALALDISKTRLFVGLRDDIIKCYDTEPLLQEGKDIVEFGVLQRKSNKPIVGFSFSRNGAWMVAACSHNFEAFQFNTADDVKKKRDRKKKRKKTESSKEDGGEEGHTGVLQLESIATIAEEVTHMKVFRVDEKIKSVRFVPAAQVSQESRNNIHVCVTLADNSIRSYTANVTEADVATGATATMVLSELRSKFTIAHAGHRNAIRSMAFTANSNHMVSLSHDGCKVWTAKAAPDYFEREQALDEAYHDGLFPPFQTLNCAGSFTLSDLSKKGEASAAAGGGEGSSAHHNITSFAIAGSEVVCVGDSGGKLHLARLPSMEVSFSTHVHHGGLSAVCAKGEAGFISIGGDRRLVEWSLALRNANPLGEEEEQADDEWGGKKHSKGNKGSNGNSAAKQVKKLVLALVREVELNESPLAVQCSMYGATPLMAVALQDHTVQLLYADTLKPFVSLYGHKLPVTEIDFSDDGVLVATGGMDKSLRFWGTDFGDCHRAIHAHDDYVTSVKFSPGTHFCFTCSLDGSIKHWDGDNWSLIQMIRIHQHGVWTVALNNDGSCVATAGLDRCIRLFQRSEEMIFPEEEEERIAQEAMDAEVARRAALSKIEDGTVAPNLVTSSTANAAENLMDALDIASVELQRLADGGKGTPHPALRQRTVWQYLWAVIESIKPCELRQATASLTSVHVHAILEFLDKMLDNGVVTNYEIAARILLAVAKPSPGSSTHTIILGFSDNTTVGGTTTMHLIHTLRTKISAGLKRSQDRLGFAIAGLKFVGDRIQEKKNVRFFDLSNVQGAKKKYHSSVIPSGK